MDLIVHQLVFEIGEPRVLIRIAGRKLRNDVLRVLDPAGVRQPEAIARLLVDVLEAGERRVADARRDRNDLRGEAEFGVVVKLLCPIVERQRGDPPFVRAIVRRRHRVVARADQRAIDDRQLVAEVDRAGRDRLFGDDRD